MKPRKTTKQFVIDAIKVHGHVFDYTNTVYVKALDKVKVGCKTHGDFLVTPNNHLNGAKCPKCRGYGLSLQEVFEKFKLVHSDKYTYRKSKNANGFEINCPVHGWFTQSRNSHMSGSGCLTCSRESRASDQTMTTKEFVRRAKKVHGHKYDYSKTTYDKSHDEVVIICKTHGEFKQKAYAHLAGNRCGKCKTSKIENLVRDWIGKRTSVESNVRLLDGKEIDVWCQEHKLGVEINGTYWHSSKFLPKKYHYDKARVAKRLGISLLQFWDHELRSKTDICKSMILSHIGMCDRYYARQLSIKPMNSSECSAFFERNHLQGRSAASVCYGLFNKDQCLAAMSFGRPRFSDKADWEIVRFANALNTTVVGGASRLWKHFVKECKPKSVITYADLRISQGQLYKTLGFKLSHVSDPNYTWSTNSLNVVSRYMTQRKHLPTLLKKFDPALSVSKNMELNGWSRLWDAGNLVFINADPDGKGSQG